MSASVDLHSLKRPGLLVRAARFQSEGPREAVFRQVFGPVEPKAADERMERLIEKEADANEKRLTGDATYSIARHIAVLAALILEANQGRHQSV